MEVKVDSIGKLRVAYLEIKGPYENWGEGLMELVSWLDGKKASIAGAPIGLFYDNPLETPAEKLRSEACVPIKGRVRQEGRFKVKELPAAIAATAVHDGPPEKYTDTFGELFEWILGNGYEFYGPAREVYPLPSKELRPGMGIIIQQPIRKKE